MGSGREGHLPGDGPQKREEFARDGGHNQVGVLPVRDEASVPFAEPDLRLPGDVLDGLRAALEAALDPHHVQSGWVDLPLDTLGLPADQGCQVHDLLSDQRHLWSGSRHFVQLDPERSPAQVFRARRRVRSEHDFDYYL